MEIHTFFQHFCPRRSLDVFHDAVDCLVTALEAKDLYTAGHSTSVADYALAIGKQMRLKASALDQLHLAAHLHDIGKIGIPEHILNKPGKLTEEEFQEIKRHPEIGHRILCRSAALERIARLVLHHHEQWNGKGYPYGLSGENIPLGSRIIAVADAIDAMLSDRPYRKGLSWEYCREELSKHRWQQFDGNVVENAIEALEQVLSVPNPMKSA